jgi:hypothetical protein
MRQLASIGFLIYLMLMFLILSGCSSKFDDCVEKEREGYRQKNPKASYGQITAKQAEFEMMCSSLKNS